MKKFLGSFILLLSMISLTFISTSAYSWTKFDNSLIFNNVYEVYSADDLIELSRISLSGESFKDKTIVLKNNIDMYGKHMKPIGLNFYTRFAGEFDGNGKEIINLNISCCCGEGAGLIGCTSPDAYIHDVKISKNCRITGYEYVGAIVGYNDGGEILRCESVASCNGRQSVGGIVGYNLNGAVRECSSCGQLDAKCCYLGGIAGYNFNGDIISCKSSNNINTSAEYVGGLVGYNYNGTVYSGEVSGYVISRGTYYGKYIGFNYISTVLNPIYI